MSILWNAGPLLVGDGLQLFGRVLVIFTLWRSAGYFSKKFGQPFVAGCALHGAKLCPILFFYMILAHRLDVLERHTFSSDDPPAQVEQNLRSSQFLPSKRG